MNRNRKANENKKIRNRVLAGSMAVVLGAGLVGSCGYQQVVCVQAAEKNSDTAQSEKKDVEKLEHVAKNVLSDNHAQDSGQLYKDESVYVKAEASGNVKKTIVTEWLKNVEKGELADCSELDEIKNLKGDETFSKGSGKDLNWQSEGQEIYYQGTTEKKLPVDVKISYKLNGKEISPEDLKGKDGKVEMKIDYQNHSTQKVNVGGKQVEMYTPFTMVTAMMLSADEYKNVKIDNGKIVSDADKNIVLGVAMPGMKENLGVKDLDIDIPESVTITADVKNASVSPTVTVASTEILEQFDLSDVKDFDDLADSMNELENAAEQLVDGSGELADGVNTLNDKSGELKEGINQFADGVNAYAGGVKELADGSQALADGAGQLKQGAGAAKAGIKTAKDGADQLMANYDGAVAGANTLNNGLSDLSNGLSAESHLGLSEQQIAGIQTLAAGMAEQSVQKIPDEVFTQMRTTKANYIAVLTAGYKETLEQQFSATVNTTANAVKGQMKDNVDKLAAGAGQLAAGVTELRNGTAQLQGGLHQLYDGSETLVQGVSDLYDGTYALSLGAAKLDKFSSLLTIGSKDLKDGGDQLTAGVSQLADGANTLSDGMSKFKEEGIDKLTSVFDGDIKNVTDRLDAMIDLGKNYKSFAGIKDGMNGSTKFIIETEGID